MQLLYTNEKPLTRDRTMADRCRSITCAETELKLEPKPEPHEVPGPGPKPELRDKKTHKLANIAGKP